MKGSASRAVLSVDGRMQPEVIEAGDTAVEQSDHLKQHFAAVDSSREDVELAEEAAGKGDSDQSEKEEAEEGGEVGALLAEAGVIVDGAGALVAAAALGDDSEGAGLHGGVGGGIVAGGGDAVV